MAYHRLNEAQRCSFDQHGLGNVVCRHNRSDCDGEIQQRTTANNMDMLTIVFDDI